MKNVKRVFALSLILLFIGAMAPTFGAADAGKVNINKASAEELTQLKKIGPKYASQIVSYRDKNGPFQQPEDITKVKGIGQKTYELNKDRISVE
jgi:competence protein ComEA